MTSRTQILAGARRFVDREGWEKLTIRRLAAEIGIGATTLYHHVRDKEDLLVLLLNDYVDQIERPELPDEPRARIIAASTALHDALAAWPWAAEVFATDGFVGRLRESALWMVEAIVAGAIDHGCTSVQAVDLFRSLWYYTIGEILVRARSDPQRRNEWRPRNVEFGSFDEEQLPRLAALGKQWPILAARDTYPLGLLAFVDGLLAQAASSE